MLPPTLIVKERAIVNLIIPPAPRPSVLLLTHGLTVNHHHALLPARFLLIGDTKGLIHHARCPKLPITQVDLWLALHLLFKKVLYRRPKLCHLSPKLRQFARVVHGILLPLTGC
jgi:hypothetical protein